MTGIVVNREDTIAKYVASILSDNYTMVIHEPLVGVPFRENMRRMKFIRNYIIVMGSTVVDYGYMQSKYTSIQFANEYGSNIIVVSPENITVPSSVRLLNYNDIKTIDAFDKIQSITNDNMLIQKLSTIVLYMWGN